MGFDGLVFDYLAKLVTNDDLDLALAQLGARKYRPSYFEPDQTWFFRLSPTDGTDAAGMQP